jgi:glutathione synthase/RimK-type ligase-like ATP-grasp enzyme
MIIPRVVIVRTNKGQKYADSIAKEVNLAGYCCGITNIKELKKYLDKNKCSPQKTIIHSRTAGPIYTYKILKELEDQGYRIINSPKAIRLTSDKYQSCIFARENNFPCVETLKSSKERAVPLIKEKIEEWGKVVAKPIISQGQGKFAFMFNKDNFNELEKIKNIPVNEIVIQKYINYQRLNRVIVIDFEAIKEAVFYDEPVNDFKCSVCLNPNVKLYKNPSQELLGLAGNIARRIKSEISFIDIFTTKDGYVLNEINTSCSLIIHERVSQYNISKKIADYLVKALNLSGQS